MLRRWMRWGKKIRPLLTAVALAVGIGVAACGDDDSGPTDTPADNVSDADAGSEADALPDADAPADVEPDVEPDAEPDVVPDADAEPGDQVDGAEDCGPAGWYGPMPCASDLECETDYGAGWYCDETATTIDPCSDSPISWPVCRDGGDAGADGGDGA